MFCLEALCLTGSGAQASLLPGSTALAWAEVGSLLLWAGSSADMSELAEREERVGTPRWQEKPACLLRKETVKGEATGHCQLAGGEQGGEEDSSEEVQDRFEAGISHPLGQRLVQQPESWSSAALGLPR